MPLARNYERPRADAAGGGRQVPPAGVVDAARADGQLSRKERADVIQLAGLLDLADLKVDCLLAEGAASVSFRGPMHSFSGLGAAPSQRQVHLLQRRAPRHRRAWEEFACQGLGEPRG